MKICEKCFDDKELSAIINSSSEIGSCPVCGAEHVHLIDVCNPVLMNSFEALFEIYVSEKELPDGYPVKDKKYLVDDLQTRWHLFNDNINSSDRYEILDNLLSESSASVKDLLYSPVGILQLHDPDYLRDNSLFKDKCWDDFVNEIKFDNRYHPNNINCKVLDIYCSYLSTKIDTKNIFYRARVNNKKEVFQTNEMFCPPADKRNDGRLNAKGIPCLYIADSPDTALHEVKPGVLDYICIGQFRPIRDLQVVDLRNIAHISPFIEGLEFAYHAINQQHLQKFSDELSKPLRKADSILDYVPSQFFVDYIKTINNNGTLLYDGILFESTVNRGGFNLAIFDENLFDCINCKLYEVTGLVSNQIT